MIKKREIFRHHIQYNNNAANFKYFNEKMIIMKKFIFIFSINIFIKISIFIKFSIFIKSLEFKEK